MAPDYVATCADNLLIACQIESAKAVENIDAILAVDGIDLMFIGPFDLSATVGQMGNLKHPEVARLIEHAEARIRAAGPSDGHGAASGLHVEGHVRARLPVRERRQRHRAAARRRRSPTSRNSARSTGRTDTAGAVARHVTRARSLIAQRFGGVDPRRLPRRIQRRDEREPERDRGDRDDVGALQVATAGR